MRRPAISTWVSAMASDTDQIALEALGVQGVDEQIEKDILRSNTLTTVIGTGDLYTEREKGLIQSKALDVEDDPIDSVLASFNAHAIILQPPYHPASLVTLTHENNTLNQCVSAMVTNIEETGFEFIDMKTKEDTGSQEIEYLYEMFDRPWDGVTFIEMRKKLRRDLESLGYAYIEVIRSQSGDIVGFRPVDAKLVRLVRRTPEDYEVVTQEVSRFGKSYTNKILKPRRRFVQVIGTKLRYFKEFGSQRPLNVYSGNWGDVESQALDLVNNMATEMIEFRIQEDVYTPYGVPRWVNQFPSALGSRMAEELNLDYFKSGGLPPAMIFITGGVLSPKGRDDLNNYLGAKPVDKLRAALLEVYSTSGDFQSAGNVKVTVERFGAERQKDSLFENYDARSTQRIRTAFRLPPMFIGLQEDYTYATARTAYMLAEAQVFGPERKEFDDVINSTLVAELAPGYGIRSKALVVNDSESQIEAIGIAKEATKKDTFISEINRIAHLNLQPGDDMKPPPPTPPGGGKPAGGGQGKTKPAAGKLTPSKTPAKPQEK